MGFAGKWQRACFVPWRSAPPEIGAVSNSRCRSAHYSLTRPAHAIAGCEKWQFSRRLWTGASLDVRLRSSRVCSNLRTSTVKVRKGRHFQMTRFLRRLRIFSAS
jgi:hypothetical protein